MALRNDDDRRERRAGTAPGAFQRLIWRPGYTWLAAALMVVFALITSGGALVGGSLLDLAAEEATIDILIKHRQFDQDDLDRKLVTVAWHDPRPAIESLMAAGADPPKLELDDPAGRRVR